MADQQEEEKMALDTLMVARTGLAMALDHGELMAAVSLWVAEVTVLELTIRIEALQSDQGQVEQPELLRLPEATDRQINDLPERRAILRSDLQDRPTRHQQIQVDHSLAADPSAEGAVVAVHDQQEQGVEGNYF